MKLVQAAASSLNNGALTVSVLVFRWLHQVFELHVDVNFDPQQQRHLQQDQLQLSDTCGQETGGADGRIQVS